MHTQTHSATSSLECWLQFYSITICLWGGRFWGKVSIIIRKVWCLGKEEWFLSSHACNEIILCQFVCLTWCCWQNMRCERLAGTSWRRILIPTPSCKCSPNKQCSLWGRLGSSVICIIAFPALPFWQNLRTTLSLPPSLHHCMYIRMCIFLPHYDLITGKCLGEICHHHLHPLIRAWL
jgi:hypothetical protein